MVEFKIYINKIINYRYTLKNLIDVENLCKRRIKLKKKVIFNPDFRDDVLYEEALYIPLFLPKEEKWNSNLWIMTRFENSYGFLGKSYNYLNTQKITALVMKNPKRSNFKIQEKDGEELEGEAKDSILNVIFPPKAWMSDHAQERTMMYACAKEAFGDVLVGGLGLLIYPQFLQILKRPIQSITIVEKEPLIIEKIGKHWIESLSEEWRSKVSIINDKIEDYLVNTTLDFDTIYLDTWDDSDPRYLAHINYLVALSEEKIREKGNIHCWSYAVTIDAFLKIVEHFERSQIEYDKIDHQELDPVFRAFIQWRKENLHVKDLNSILQKAKEIGNTVSVYCEYDEIKKFYTPYR